MSIEGGVKAFEIDLSNVPVRPTSKREVKQLETALIIATIYRPEVLELIKDPLEKATWVDSLAVAAAALAREKAGYTIPQIAEELGRSETTIRAHLQGKTKAGKLVKDTYEQLVRGRLRIVVPFVEEAPLSQEELLQLREAKERLEQLEKKLQSLEEENRKLREQLEKCISREEVEKTLEEAKNAIERLEKENEQLRQEVNDLKYVKEKLRKIK